MTDYLFDNAHFYANKKCPDCGGTGKFVVESHQPWKTNDLVTLCDCIPYTLDWIDFEYWQPHTRYGMPNDKSDLPFNALPLAGDDARR